MWDSPSHAQRRGGGRGTTRLEVCAAADEEVVVDLRELDLEGQELVPQDVRRRHRDVPAHGGRGGGTGRRWHTPRPSKEHCDGTKH